MQIRKTLKVAVLSAVVLGLPAAEHVQANLINLYNWSNATRYSGAPQNNINILSLNSASFYGSLGTSPVHPLALPILTGNLATAPGAIYEISFIMQNNWLTDIGQIELSFGSFTTNFDLPPAQQAGGLRYFPVNIDFTAVANSLTTTMTFTVPVDVGGGISLGDFSVSDVPESTPTAGLFGFGVCALLFARHGRRWFQTSKPN